MVNLGNFKIDDTGQYFLVLVYQDYVVKIPRKRLANDVARLEEIAKLQTYLSDIDGILPCQRVNNCLVMPRAKGKRLDEIDTDLKRMIKQTKLARIKDSIRKKGCIVYDIGDKDIFYEEGTGEVTIVDFHQVERVRKVEEQ